MALGEVFFLFFFQAEDGIRDVAVTGVQTCALPILAGLFLAHLLRVYGVRVAVLEAGGMASLPVRDYGVECLQVGTPYRGAEAGRNFGLGGTSATWGGQLIRPSQSDTEERSEVHGASWPIRSAELDRFYERVRRDLRMPGSANRAESEICREQFLELQG